jgi:hypothetical protein
MKIVINLPFEYLPCETKEDTENDEDVRLKRERIRNARTPNKHIAKIAALPSFENNC